MKTEDHDMNESEYAAYKLGYQAGLAKSQRDDDDAFWIRQYAGMAMQGILASNTADTRIECLPAACAAVAKALLQEVEKLKEENSHLWVRVESGEAAAYEQGKAEARKQTAAEILDLLTQEEIRRITSVGDPRVTTISSKLLAMMTELRQRYGLEG